VNEMFSCYRRKEADAAAVTGGPGVRRSRAGDWWRTPRTAAASAGRGRTRRRRRRRRRRLGAAGAAAEVEAAAAAAASSPPPRRRREGKNAEEGLGFWIRAAGKGSAASGFGVRETMGSAVDEPRSREPSSQLELSR
jgi:hypothetical protein